MSTRDPRDPRSNMHEAVSGMSLALGRSSPVEEAHDATTRVKELVEAIAKSKPGDVRILVAGTLLEMAANKLREAMRGP